MGMWEVLTDPAFCPLGKVKPDLCVPLDTWVTTWCCHGKANKSWVSVIGATRNVAWLRLSLWCVGLQWPEIFMQTSFESVLTEYNANDREREWPISGMCKCSLGVIMDWFVKRNVKGYQGSTVSPLFQRARVSSLLCKQIHKQTMQDLSDA